jgi:hypothetical protein
MPAALLAELGQVGARDTRCPAIAAWLWQELCALRMPAALLAELGQVGARDTRCPAIAAWLWQELCALRMSTTLLAEFGQVGACNTRFPAIAVRGACGRDGETARNKQRGKSHEQCRAES